LARTDSRTNYLLCTIKISQSPDPHLERRIRRDTNYPNFLWEQTTILVERPFMAAQARNQCLASQEPLENILEENTDEDIATPEPTLPGSPGIESTFQNEISNLKLCNALLALARMTTPQTKKKN